MNCPQCASSSLNPVALGGNLQVDQCTSCSGVWFDRGEIGSYLKFSKDVPDIKELEAQATVSSRRCPRCAVSFKERRYVSDSALKIDYCPQCQGVWLDGGEMEELRALAVDPSNRKLRLMRAVWELRAKAGIAESLPCPKCRAPTLNELNTGEGVSVDFCRDCKGVWFQRGELARMVELSKDIPDLKAALSTARPTNLKCPRCHEALKEVRYSQLNALLVDYCQRCEGLWLDPGELSTVEGLATILESPGSRLGRALKQLHDEGYVLAGIQ